MTTPPVPVLSGTRVVLARLRQEDVPELTRHFQNLELTTYLGGYGRTYSLEDEQAYFDSVSRNRPEAVLFGIYSRQDGRLIGGVELRAINHQFGTAELGVSIHDPAYWGEGSGSEAVRLMLQYGMFHLGLYNVILKVFAFNTRAVRAYEKVGFREIGRRTGAVKLGQERFDEVFMDITADRVDTSDLRAQISLLS